MSTHRYARRIPWFRISILALSLWIVFGLVPVGLAFIEWITHEQLQYFSPFGDMFGAANAFFSGFALIAVLVSIQMQTESLATQKEELELTREELKESTQAQQEMARQQKQAIALQVVMPIMDEIGSEEFRRASNVLGELERAGNIGRYRQLRAKDSRSADEQAEFDRIDSARRRFVHLFHKLNRLRKSGVVEDDIVRTVVGPDLVWTLLYIDEPMEEAIRENYSHETFVYFQSLYSPAQIEGQWPRNAANPLSRRFRATLEEPDTNPT
jgi:hypothetical protein